MSKAKDSDVLYKDCKFPLLEASKFPLLEANKIPDKPFPPDVSQFTNSHRVERQRTRHKPYDPVDSLNMDRLSISAKKSRVVKQPINTHSCRVKNQSSERHHKHSLIRPSKLHITQATSCSTQSNEVFDFAALAAQVPVAKSNTSTESTNTFNWSKLRDTLPTNTSQHVSQAVTSSPCKEDGELSSLSRLASPTIDTEETATLRSSPRTSNTRLVRSCSQEAMFNESDFTAEELAYYFDELVYIPKKMSEMAEMMYT